MAIVNAPTSAPEQRKSYSYRSPVSGQSHNAAPLLRTSSSAQHRPNSAGATRRDGTGVNGASSTSASASASASAATESSGETRKPDHPILFQTFFKSVGSRTYAAQIKQATNGNQYLVITEGRRDKNSDDVRKLRINIFSEDFEAFFNLLRETTKYIKEHPLPAEFQAERKKFWQNLDRKKAGMNRGDAPRRSSAR